MKQTLRIALTTSTVLLFSQSVMAGHELKVIDYKGHGKEFTSYEDTHAPKRKFFPTAGYRGFGFEAGEQEAFLDKYDGILSSPNKDSRTKLRNDLRNN